MNCIYRLEEVKYYRYDFTENEDVEFRKILGHFNSLEKLNDAIEYFIQNGTKKNQICISTFFDKFAGRQKYVYVLSHQYSLQKNGEIIDYEYIFRPFSNRKKCLLLKEKLMEESKFKYKDDRCYRIQPPDGFYISKQKINVIYSRLKKDAVL